MASANIFLNNSLDEIFNNILHMNWMYLFNFIWKVPPMWIHKKHLDETFHSDKHNYVEKIMLKNYFHMNNNKKACTLEAMAIERWSLQNIKSKNALEKALLHVSAEVVDARTHTRCKKDTFFFVDTFPARASYFTLLPTRAQATDLYQREEHWRLNLALLVWIQFANHQISTLLVISTHELGQWWTMGAHRVLFCWC
jgi:hypothetical protein